MKKTHLRIFLRLKIWYDLIERWRIQPGQRSYASMFRICSRSRELFDRAVRIYLDMITSGVEPEASIYAMFIRCCRTSGDVEKGTSQTPPRAPFGLDIVDISLLFEKRRTGGLSFHENQAEY